MPRSYQLGRRQGAVDRTRLAILAAAREELASGEPGLSTGAVARRAGVSRVTVYNQFGSKAALLRELALGAPGRPAESLPPADPRAELLKRVGDASELWSSHPALYRRLPHLAELEADQGRDDHALASRLADADQLRAGCSLREAEDLIGAVASFAMFDRLHRDGRRSVNAVVGILMRLASTILRAGSPST